MMKRCSAPQPARLSRLLHDPRSTFMGLPYSWGSCTGVTVLLVQFTFGERQVVGWDWTSRMPQSVVLVARLSHNPASLTFSAKGACFVPWKRYHNIRCQRLQRPTGQLWHLWRVTRTITTHKIHFKFNTKSVQQFWASIFIFRLYSVHFYVLWWLVPLPFFRCVVQDGPIPNLYL